jgi:hypothetical protein
MKSIRIKYLFLLIYNHYRLIVKSDNVFHIFSDKSNRRKVAPCLGDAKGPGAARWQVDVHDFFTTFTKRYQIRYQTSMN